MCLMVPRQLDTRRMTEGSLGWQTWPEYTCRLPEEWQVLCRFYYNWCQQPSLLHWIPHDYHHRWSIRDESPTLRNSNFREAWCFVHIGEYRKCQPQPRRFDRREKSRSKNHHSKSQGIHPSAIWFLTYYNVAHVFCSVTGSSGLVISVRSWILLSPPQNVKLHCACTCLEASKVKMRERSNFVLTMLCSWIYVLVTFVYVDRIGTVLYMRWAVLFLSPASPARTS